jgi:aminoglycoside/choline kinase family phosphotransferase
MMPERDGDASFTLPGENQVAGTVSRLLGRRVSDVSEIVPGLGARRFLRIRLEGSGVRSVIARLEDPSASTHGPMGIASEPPLEPLRGFLEGAGLPVPARLAADESLGLELLEDVGDRSLERAAREVTADERQRLYRAACALIPRLQTLRAQAGEIPAFGRRLDAALIATKATKFAEWTLPVAFGRPATRAELGVVTDAFSRIASLCDRAPRRLAHRDFKAANLHLGSDGRLVMIDLQGAFLAPPEYDAVCLLRDSHVRLPEQEVAAHLEWLRPQLPDAPGETEFLSRFDLITLVRVAKDLSHYLDAARTRDDRRYLEWVPNAVSTLQSAVRRASGRDAAFADLAELIGRIPANPDPPGPHGRDTKRNGRA